MWNIRWNENWQGKLKYSEKTCPRATLSTTNPTWLGLEPGPPQWKTSDYFLIGIVGYGVQLGPLDTAATNRPIVPVPGDYDNGEISGMIGKGNRSTRTKPAPASLCPPHFTHDLNSEPGPPQWETSDYFGNWYSGVCQSRAIMTMEKSVEWLARETEVLGQNLFQRHFVHHISHMTWAPTRAAAMGSQRLTAWAVARRFS
jgi:hypothetical protein